MDKDLSELWGSRDVQSASALEQQETAMAEFASSIYTIYRSFKNAGFSDQQAFHLANSQMVAMITKAQ